MWYSLRPMNEQTKNSGWIGPQDALGELQRRTAMLDAIGYAATRIVTSGDWRAGIQELLDRLGHATGASRVSLFEIHHDAKGLLVESCRYDWVEPGQPSMSADPRYQNMPLVDPAGVVDDWTERRQRGEVVQALQRDLTGYNRQVFEETSTLIFHLGTHHAAQRLLGLPGLRRLPYRARLDGAGDRRAEDGGSR